METQESRFLKGAVRINYPLTCDGALAGRDVG
jgi:hypothetical protein